MGVNEQFKFVVLEEYRSGRKSRKEAAILLGRSERTIDRMLKMITEEGIIGLKHGNHNRPPKNKTPEELREKISALYSGKYYDFNMTHFREMLLANESLPIGYQSLRRLCHEKGHVKLKRKNRRKNKYHRDRMASTGLLLQMDGSHHDWNGKEKWCLIAMIDDADSEITYAEFFKSEDTINCLKVLEAVIAAKGIPHAVYVDKAGWFGGLKRQEFSQFVRACEELGIKVIYANSPEAKGRIERAWHTFQDRLIPEMRLHGIETMEQANIYLNAQFLPNYWNKQNTVTPANSTSCYRKIPLHMDIAQHCCLKDIRQVRNDLTIMWDNKIYKIERTFLGPIKGRKVEIRTYWNGQWHAFLGRIPLSLTPVYLPPKRHLSVS